jgi:hypothetical protein
MPTVNIKTATYINTNPNYANMINVSASGVPTITTNTSTINNLKNSIYTNVMVKGVTKSSPIFVRSTGDVGATIGGFSMGLEMFTSTDPGFVDYNNLNFKLTPQGLANVQATLPTFVDIPFEDIPTINYDPLA